jgi:Alpha-acetolactate decarboxylase
LSKSAPPWRNGREAGRDRSIRCHPASLKAALGEETARSGRSTSALVTSAQVSTSGALVAGDYDREVSIEARFEQGNFGLGTFADLDGEMVLLTPQCAST